MSVWDDLRQDIRMDQIAADAAASVAEMGSATGDGIGANHALIQNLFALDRAQSEEISRLRATVRVLVDMLLEAKAVDETAFKYRLEAEIDRVTVEQQIEAAEARKVTCYNCGKGFDPQQTQVDATGTICDGCFHRTA